ncbi:hypothetical protein DXA21_21085 [Parabacteroides distasonis]|nr:hypothetical protein DXA21_21085 [Parabacteroides distasonis]
MKLQEKEYVTVTDIEKYLKDKGCAVGLTTIYRHLDKMEKDGIVARINVENHLPTLGQNGKGWHCCKD